MQRMEIPASLVRRKLSGIEMRLACIVYGCANIDDAVPKCTLSKARVMGVLACGVTAFDEASRKIAKLGYWRRVPVNPHVWRWEILIKPVRGFQYGEDPGFPGTQNSGYPLERGGRTRNSGPHHPAFPAPTTPEKRVPRTGKEQEGEQTTEQQQQLAAADIPSFLDPDLQPVLTPDDIAELDRIFFETSVGGHQDRGSPSGHGDGTSKEDAASKPILLLNAQRSALGADPVDDERERATVRKAIARAAAEGLAAGLGCDPATLVACGLMAGAARHMNGPRDNPDVKSGKRALPSALCKRWSEFVDGARQHYEQFGASPEPKRSPRQPKQNRKASVASHGPRR